MLDKQADQGISITPAPGWTVLRQGQHWVNLLNRDDTAGVFATAGSADAPDINQEATILINKVIQVSGMTNVQQSPAGQVQPGPGNNFQQMLEVGYTGNAQTNRRRQQH